MSYGVFTTDKVRKISRKPLVGFGIGTLQNSRSFRRLYIGWIFRYSEKETTSWSEALYANMGTTINISFLLSPVGTITND